MLAALGLALLVLLVLLVVFFVNYPAGSNALFGLNLHAIELFRRARPYPDLELTPQSFQLRAQLVMVALWLVYLTGLPVVQRLERSSRRKQAFYLVGAIALSANVLLVLLMPPVLSSDVYHYALYGRMVADHGINPYVSAGNMVPDDPFWSLTSWRVVRSRYGPVWTITSAGLAVLGGGSVLRTVVAFKVLAAAANLGSGALVFLLARRLTPGFGLVPLVLFVWNPLILLETAGAAHADAVMLLLALLGLWLGLRGRALAGLAFLVLSTQVKLTTALVVPLYVAMFWREWVRAEKGLRFVVQSIVVALGTLAVLYLPFAGQGAGPLRVLFAGDAALNVMPNPMWLSMRRVAFAMAGQLKEREAGAWLVLALSVGFFVLVAWQAVRIVRQGVTWPHLIWLWGLLTFMYLYLVHGASFPWYVIVPLTAATIPWAAGRTHRLWAICVTVAMVSTLLYTIPVRVLWTVG